MKFISAAEARMSLSDVLDAVEQGEEFVVTRHGRPAAVIGPVSARDSKVATTPETVREAPAAYGAHEWRSAVSGVSASGGERLFASRGMRGVLSLFVLHPDREFYQREISRRTGVPLRSVQLALERLEGLGFVEGQRSGNRMQYRVVPSAGFDALRQWAIPQVALVPLLREALEPLGQAVEMAFIYGSTATGQDTATSDIDLMVVGEGDTYDIILALEPTERQVGREINVTRYDPAEFSEKVRAKSHFLTTVLRGPLIWILGEREVSRDA